MEIVWTFFKYILMFFISYFIYLVYIAILNPLIFWYKYKKYPNVYTSSTFRPIVGDMQDHLDDAKAGRAHYYHNVTEAKKRQNYDLRVAVEGVRPVMKIVSARATEEFIALVPQKIDRAPERKGFGRMFPKAIANHRTTEKVSQRRKLFTSLLSLNFASKYIPGMLSCCRDVLDSMKDGETYGFLDQMNKLTFDIFMNVLYGDDVHHLTNRSKKYRNPDGTVTEIPMKDIMIGVTKGHIDDNYNPFSRIFPILCEKSLIDPFRRNHEN
jgi:hypothetical protein